MKRVLMTILIVSAGLVTTQVLAVDGAAPSQNPKRQFKDCMLKRMSADKNLSYVGAAKVCKEDQAKTTAPLSASSGLTSSGMSTPTR